MQPHPSLASLVVTSITVWQAVHKVRTFVEDYVHLLEALLFMLPSVILRMDFQSGISRDGSSTAVQIS
jgi:hypothetical protein